MKLVDSTQLDADLTSVANAIRSVSGSSGRLAFPNGFVSEIWNISTGSGGHMAGIDIYIGDYTNDVVTVTVGSKDSYYRRIYVE